MKVYLIFLTLSAPTFRLPLSSALFLNKLSIGKKLICKVERLNVKRCLQKYIIVAYSSERVNALHSGLKVSADDIF